MNLTIRGLCLSALFFLFFSCNKKNVPPENLTDLPTVEHATLINSFEVAQIQEIEQKLNQLNPKYGAWKAKTMLKEETAESRSLSFFINAYKVVFSTPHPDGVSTPIQASGVILIPKYRWKKYRILYSPVGTYTNNDESPSEFFEDFSLDISEELEGIYNYTILLQAAKGFAVFVPDYPCFGSSLGDCDHPYVIKDVHNQSNLDFLNAGIAFLSSKGYHTKEDILIAGYSQGGFSTLHFAKYLETHTNIGIKAVAAGGNPTSTQYILERVKTENTHPNPYFIAYALFGWNKNNITSSPINRVFLEPYASTAFDLFDGTKSIFDVSKALPKKISELYTTDFINADVTDSQNEFHNIYLAAKQNNLIPWNNNVPIRMYHGSQDTSVYYQQAYDYYLAHDAQYGNIQFKSSDGNHSEAFWPYYWDATAWFLKYK